MNDITDSSNLNCARANDEVISARALRIESISSTQDKIEIRSRCPTCNSQVLMIVSKETRDALDLNGKRHFCEPEDRRGMKRIVSSG